MAGRAIPALHPTGMTIETGEVFGIVGHSGAGKSTLVRLINLLERSTGGRVLVDGEDVIAMRGRAAGLPSQGGHDFPAFNLLSSRPWRTILPSHEAGRIYSKAEIASGGGTAGTGQLTDQGNKYPSQFPVARSSG